MDFKQLEAFVTAVDCNSFSEAAKKLFLTQPTISAHISALEKELHTKLILRTTKKMELTFRGQQFYEYAVNILNMRNNIINDFTGGTRKVITFGVSTIPSSYILPELLSSFSRQAPGIVFNVLQSDSKKVINKVLDGTIDFGLTGAVSDSNDCVYIPFFQDELTLAAPATSYYQHLKESNVPLKRILQEPIIMRENGSGTQKEIEKFLSAQEIDLASLHIIARMNDLESIKRSIVCGLGISFVSTLSIKDLLENGQILEFSTDGVRHKRNLYLVYNKRRIHKPHVMEMIQFLKKQYPDIITE
ncbi:MAG: selenium metabolism-associated LysR family transcriptional regulator [Lachnospiraceae bacterium]